jgi:hypothetical protein
MFKIIKQLLFNIDFTNRFNYNIFICYPITATFKFLIIREYIEIVNSCNAFKIRIGPRFIFID